MILAIAPAKARGLALFVLAAALAACESHKPPMTEIQRDDAERQALIQAMKRHPALAEGGNNAAMGKPIDVPTTVPPKAPGPTIVMIIRNPNQSRNKAVRRPCPDQ
ncbi:hypothetical protein H9L14_02390 [Sphingomonas sediminicola]|uniref:DUF3035 domain-containing protein n=1 Tax=Sphingomonas sediminicola TaxID=386874 RepID=A0ABX6T906_9SPHN|nr:hypothetical protein [Sphingomonas sediminicola]QNP46130.1 hypothetical protein H9L14_02390 [Sphingomonas sediminicola]